jgi:UDP-2,4-diacetamido-2,4,6-trideoxy-beta-L-altropyranose hydrolase
MGHGARPRSIVIRCDGSARIGMGHLGRCLSLALELQKLGWDVSFAMQVLDGRAAALAMEEGMSILPIPGDGGTDLSAEDCRATADFAAQQGAACVLVDHYGADACYIEALSERVPVGVIDDMADRDLTAASWVLNQNLGAEALPYRLSAGCVCAFGPSYAMLRPSFVGAACASGGRRFSAEDRRVLLTLGGGDTAAITAEVLQGLAAVPRQLEIVCILGPHGGTARAVHEIAGRSRHRVTVLGDVRQMAFWMNWADMSINAGGSTCWELCCLGVPMLIIAEQRFFAGALSQGGCAVSLGESAAGALPPDLAANVEMVLADSDRRAGMSGRGRELVDGRGAERAARLLVKTMASAGESFVA